MKDNLKVLYMTNIPAPYRVEFFNELGKKCDLTVLFEIQQATNRDVSWTDYNDKFYRKKQLRGIRIGKDNAICIDILKYLDEKKYDVIVVGGYSTPTAMLAILYMKIKRIPFMLNADGGQVKKDKWFMRVIKKFFISSARGYLSTGKYTDEYFEYYGAKREWIFQYPFTSVKEDEILKTIPSDIEKKALKEKMGIDDERIVISVGQFVYRKGLDVLIKSMGSVHEATLYVIGGQPTKEYLDLISDLGLTNVKFFSFMSPQDLLTYYQIADVFVLPTRQDIWGLVINEAMAQALPVITTNRCVAGLELICNSQNGFIVPSENVNELAEKINVIIANRQLRTSMAENALSAIKEYSIENMAKKHMEIFVEYVEVLSNESYTN